MSAVSPAIVYFGWKAPDFRLSDTHGKVWTRDSLRGPKGLGLVFMCNHCPYVQAIVDKMVKDFRVLHDLGYGAAGIPEEFRGRPSLEKPFLIETLARTIDSTLRSHRSENEAP